MLWAMAGINAPHGDSNGESDGIASALVEAAGTATAGTKLTEDQGIFLCPFRGTLLHSWAI